MNKRLLSLVLCIVMLSGSATGCHNVSDADVATSQSTAAITSEATTETETEFSTAVPETEPPTEETVTADDLLNAAETRRAEFMKRRCEPQFTDGGKVYYISPDGCDDNDGLSPETAWASLDRAFETHWPTTRDLLKYGDTVLLERDGIWYVSPDEHAGLTSDAYNIVNGVTLGAYGEGERPVIRGDIPEADDASFWTLYHDDGGKKIWASKEKLQDSNVIVFNGGEFYAEEILPYWSTTLNDYCDKNGEPFDITAELDNNLSFCCMLELDGPECAQLEDCTARGTLYLRCDEGNPAEVFDELALPQAQTGLGLWTDSTITDLDLRYFTCIAAELSSYGYYTGQQVVNCEVSWSGGLISNYHTEDWLPDGVMRQYCAGGALQVSGSRNSVRDCYIHDCGPMTLIVSIHANDAEYLMYENMTYTGNLFENCGAPFHIADLVKMDHKDAEGYIQNLVFADNIVMHSGGGWIEELVLQTADETSSFLSAVENTMGAANNDNIRIADNIFYGSAGSLLCLTDYLWNSREKANNPMTFSGNIYAQVQGGLLCRYNWQHGWGTGYEPDEKTFLAHIGDTTGKIVCIP